MKITLIQIGKTSDDYLISGIQEYEKRLKHYIQFEIITIDNVKNSQNLSKEELKRKETDLIFSKLPKNCYLVLLDEKGKSKTSIEFANFLQSKFNQSLNVVFVIGGAFGFSETMYNKADYKLSLSKLTFSHQMVRLFFVEQLYRAMTIIKNERYHH